jgi:hypothetical protein
VTTAGARACAAGRPPRSGRRRPRRPARSFDLVVCRNTVIPFRPDVRDDLHARLADALRPGGVLLVSARMFGAGSGSLDVGARNEVAVRDALTTARLRVRAAATGGDKGRTVRVDVGSGQVLVRIAQRADELIMESAA